MIPGMVAVLLADGFEEVEAITPIDFLRRANISVLTVGVSRTVVHGAHNIPIVADIALADYTAIPQYLILPGGMPGSQNLYTSTQVRTLLAAVHARKDGIICAICAAPAIVLAPLGYLNNKRFTCYPSYAADISVGEYTEAAVVHDGNIISSRGAGTAAFFSAKIIAHIKGTQVAQQIMASTLQPI